MPTYDYVCDRCGHEFELFQKMTDPPRKRCPRCRGTVRRRIGAGAGLLFKGTGFYATDYRSPEYQTKARAETRGPEPASKPAGGTDGKKADGSKTSKEPPGSSKKS